MNDKIDMSNGAIFFEGSAFIVDDLEIDPELVSLSSHRTPAPSENKGEQAHAPKNAFTSREDFRKLGVIARQLTLKRGEVRAISFVYPDSSPYYAKEECAVFLLPPVLRKKWFKLDLELLKGIGKMKSMRNTTRRIYTVGISKQLLERREEPPQLRVSPLEPEQLGSDYKTLLAVLDKQ